MPLLTPLALMNRNRTVSGVHLGRLWGEVPMLRAELVDVLGLWRAGAVKPRIDSVFPFGRAADAHRRLTDRHNIGKVVLVP